MIYYSSLTGTISCKMARMKQIFLMIVAGALVGCGKKEEKAATSASTSADHEAAPVVPTPIEEGEKFSIFIDRQWIPPEEITDQRTIDFQIRNVFFGGFGYGVALENPQLAKDLEWPSFGIDSQAAPEEGVIAITLA